MFFSYTYLIRNTHKIFVADAFGALLSAMLLSVFAFNPQWSGIPQHILWVLASIAAALSFYGWTQVFGCKEHKELPLKKLAVSNLLYAFISIYILFHFSNGITKLGWFYFIGEIAIILIIATIEWSVYLRHKK